MASLRDSARDPMASANHSQSKASFSPLQLPLTVLDTLVPGSSLLASLLPGLGVDASLFVSWIAIIVAVWAALHFGLVVAWDSIVKTLGSSVVVEEYDPIYNHVLTWASGQKSLQNIRSLRTQTPGQYDDAFDDEHEEEDDQQMQIRESMSDDMIFNFNSWSARAPPQYRPHSSSGWFLHDHHLFRFHRARDRVSSEIGLVYEKERLEIVVLWLSPKPVKKLIEEAREFVLARRTSTTTIKRPTPKSQRNSRHQAWTTMAHRPSRPMATVVLDNNQKASILRDFNEFLHPRTERWYSNRGVPYRRGYLFHGPPGTGKTSLSFALAGVFGLDIYSLALSEATLTEEDLILLFNSLPKRCILLLEDVDTAGLGRAPGGQQTSGDTSTGTASRDSRKHKKEEDQSPVKPSGQPHLPNANAVNPSFKNTLTLSGLLNAIDGVASQEGRVLIMTTNHPERLDPALTRPGRVDLTIKFDLANGQQIKDLFLRMYCADTPEMRLQPTRISHILPDRDRQRPDTHSSSIRSAGDDEHHLDHDKTIGSGALAISNLAEEFARVLPNGTFSPAEIQGYLLVRKTDPKKAAANVTTWRDEQLHMKSESVAEGPGNNAILSVNGGQFANLTVPERAVSERMNDFEGQTSIITDRTITDLCKDVGNAGVNGSVTPSIDRSSAQLGTSKLNTGSPAVCASPLQVHRNEAAIAMAFQAEPSSDADDPGSTDEDCGNGFADCAGPSDDKMQDDSRDDSSDDNGRSTRQGSLILRARGPSFAFGSGMDRER